MTTTPTILGNEAAPRGNGTVPVPAALYPVLERLASESRWHFGIDDARLDALWYKERPFSHVAKVAVRASADGAPARHLFVKLFKTAATPEDVERIRQRIARDFETTTRLYKAMSQSADLGVVRPVACYPEHLATITEEASGATLLDYLESHAGWRTSLPDAGHITATMERVGRWVCAFQSIGPQGASVSVDALRSYVDLRLRRLTSLPAAAFAPADREQVRAYIDRLGSAVDPVDLAGVPIHADLAPANIMVSDGRVTVLDLAMASTGSRLHDLARLHLQLDLLALKPHFRRTVLQRLNPALLRGFDPELSVRRPMFRLLLMQHRINHLATLSSVRERFPASVYNWHVRRSHRAWIARELRSVQEGG